MGISEDSSQRLRRVEAMLGAFYVSGNVDDSWDYMQVSRSINWKQFDSVRPSFGKPGPEVFI